MKKYKYAVVIGRFQPVHNGHLELFKAAESLADSVVVLIGSSYCASNIKNPFTYRDRSLLIKTIKPSYITLPLTDVFYDDNAWAAQVDKHIKSVDSLNTNSVVIVGHKKDRSSYYLDMFPQYAYHEVERSVLVNATDIRERWYKTGTIGVKVPYTTQQFMQDYDDTDFNRLADEFEFIENYKRVWERSPYPVIFQTVDAVVTRSNHVLMIKRRAAPGKGLWALPGGFLNYREKTLDGAIRELKEETKLDIPDKILYNCMKNQKRFDHPERSLRGRTITEAFHFDLPNGKLDKVKGSDDAVKAKWIHINDLDPEMIYEDHYSIIKYFV